MYAHLLGTDSASMEICRFHLNLLILLKSTDVCEIHGFHVKFTLLSELSMGKHQMKGHLPRKVTPYILFFVQIRRNEQNIGIFVL